MIITKENLQQFEDRFRRAFVNSLAGFRQVALIGSRSKEGQTNLAIFNSLIHLGANPALFGLISRPDSVPRDTLQNIVDTGYYSINYVSADAVEKAHQTSARYAKNVSEFEQVGFLEQSLEPFPVPFIGDAIVKIAMKFEEKIDIKINGTILIVGSLQYVSLNETLVQQDGFVDLAAAEALVSCGLDAYFKPEPLTRLSYAKPDKWPQKI